MVYSKVIKVIVVRIKFSDNNLEVHASLLFQASLYAFPQYI